MYTQIKVPMVAVKEDGGVIYALTPKEASA